MSVFYQAMRDQMVPGKALRGPDHAPQITQARPGSTVFSSSDRGSALIAVSATHVGGFYVRAAGFAGTFEPDRKVHEGLAMNPSRIPGLMAALASAAGVQGEVRVQGTRRAGLTTIVEADLYWHNHLVVPPSCVYAELDYETGQLENWRVIYSQLPTGVPPIAADVDATRDRVLQALMIRRDVGYISNIKMLRTVRRLGILENVDPNRVTFADSDRIAAARENRGIYTWALTADTAGRGVVNAFLDFETGELLEYELSTSSSGGTDGTANAAAKRLPTMGPYRLVSEGRSRVLHGGLELEKTTASIMGVAVAFVVDDGAVRGIFDRQKGLLRVATATYRPTGSLLQTLKNLR